VIFRDIFVMPDLNMFSRRAYFLYKS